MEEKLQIIFLLVCYNLIMPFLLFQNAHVAPFFSDGVTPVRTDAVGRIAVLCVSSLLFSNCTVFVLGNMEHYYCLFSVLYLKIAVWYQILIRHLKSDKTHERVRAEKLASSSPSCLVAWPFQDGVGFFWLVCCCWGWFWLFFF